MNNLNAEDDYENLDWKSKFIKKQTNRIKGKVSSSRSTVLRTNFLAFMTTTAILVLFEAIEYPGKENDDSATFDLSCRLLSRDANKLRKIYLFLSICYFMSSLFDLSTYYFFKSIFTSVASAMFSFVATISKIFVEFIYLFFVSLSLLEREDCGVLTILSIIWLMVAGVSMIAYVVTLVSLYSHYLDTAGVTQE